LQVKIRELTQRVRRLEDALSVVQAIVSKEPHPLLDPQHQIQPLDLSETSDQVDDILGSLTIQDHSEIFFGPTAGSESLRFTQSGVSEDFLNANNVEGQNPPLVYTELSRLTGLFPFLPGGQWHNGNSLYTILDLLPEQTHAWSLSETYFEHVRFFALS
jgi:hypothetical protein